MRGHRAIFSLAVAAAASASALGLPQGPILAAYPSGGECDSKVITGAEQGVNVVIWAFLALAADAKGNPVIDISQAPDGACVAATWNKLQSMKLETTFMISIGGWGTPHPAVTAPSMVSAVYASWKDWNAQHARNYSWPGFGGIDWDLEGVNDLSSPDNHFTVDCLDLVGKMSQMAKADGFAVSLVPPESYLEAGEFTFNRNLNNSYSDFVPSFTYHGAGAYAYIVSRYNKVQGGGLLFDFITVQLYESYSRALQNMTYVHQPAADWFAAYIPKFYDGWLVDFGSDPALDWPTQQVVVNQTQLVIGLANGWTDGSRALLLWPGDVEAGWNALKAKGLQHRGYAFWCLENEGTVMPNGTALYLAAGLNAFLHTRP
jgi:hypothetical protein